MAILKDTLIQGACRVIGDAYMSQVTASAFKKDGSSDSYVLLGGGGHKAVSDFLQKTSSNRPGVTKLFRKDADSNYNVQVDWTGTYWRLRGYNGDTYHNGCQVAYADSAGSTSSATTASKLDTNAGSATNPVYFSGGVPVACTYSLNKTVPADAVFTDNDTKNTAGADNTTDKIFLVGPKSQTTSNGTARTYSNVNCYASGGYLYSNGTKVLTGITSSDVTTALGFTPISRWPTYAEVTSKPIRLDEYITSNDLSSSTYNGFGRIYTGSPFSSLHTSNVDCMTINTAYSSSWAGQLATDYRTNNIAYRAKNNGTWTEWALMLSDKNYTSYTVQKDGTGASGTWGISITGNADSATRMKLLADLSGSTVDLNTALAGGGLIRNYGGTSYWTNRPTDMTYGMVAQINAYSNSHVLSAQFAWDVNHADTTDCTKDLYFRVADVNDYTYSQWHKVLDSNNFTSYALKNYGNDNSRPNSSTFTMPAGANPVSMRSGATSGADVGIFWLSDDNAFVCNSSDNGYLFAAFDTDRTSNFSTSDNAAFAVLSDNAGITNKGDLFCAGALFAGSGAAGVYYHSSGIAGHNSSNSYTRSFIDIDLTNNITNIYGLCKISDSSYANQLTIHRNDGAGYDSVINYSNNTGVLGRIGMSGNTTNIRPIYVDGNNSEYTILHSGNAADYVVTRRDIGSASWRWSGNGNYRYCKIATINTNPGWIDENTMIEFSGRNAQFGILRIDFASQSAADPSLVSFSINVPCGYYLYLYKASTSVWELYADLNGFWESLQIHRIIGANEGIITINMEDVSSLPSSGLIAVSFEELYGCAIDIRSTNQMTIAVDTTSAVGNYQQFKYNGTVKAEVGWYYSLGAYLQNPGGGTIAIDDSGLFHSYCRTQIDGNFTGLGTSNRFSCGYFNNTNPSPGALDVGTFAITPTSSGGGRMSYGLFSWVDYYSGCSKLQSGYCSAGDTNLLPMTLQPLGGNVGIGVSSPSYKLQVGGDFYASGSANFGTGLTTPALTVSGPAIFSQSINGSILGNATTASRLQNARSLWGQTFDGSGDVSGMISLPYDNSLGLLFRPDNSSYYTGFYYGSYGNEFFSILTANSVTSIILGNGYNPAWMQYGSFISGSSSLNYGTSYDVIQIKNNCMAVGGIWRNGVTPDCKLYVGGDAQIWGSLHIFPSGGGDHFYLSQYSSNLIVWNSANNISMGYFTPDYGGNAGSFHTDFMYASSYTTTSDLRLKDKVQKISDNVNQFVLKAYPDRVKYGFIAQELEKTNPELVFDNGDNLSVDYNSALCLMLSKAENRIKELEGKVADLEKKINS